MVGYISRKQAKMLGLKVDNRKASAQGKHDGAHVPASERENHIAEARRQQMFETMKNRRPLE